MKKHTRLFATACFFILLIVVGLFAGHHLRPSMIQNMVQTTQTEPESVSTPLSDSQNVYEISPPSRGPWIRVIPIDIIPQNDKARVLLTGDQAKNIAPGQNVLLYDNAGMLMEILGRIENITNDPGELSADIALNGEDEFPSTAVARGEVVIYRETDAQRLPLSALVKDEDGAPYVWEVTESENASPRAHRVAANVLTTTTQFFVIAQNPVKSNVFILNPDDALRDGQTINVRKKLFSGPALADDTMVEQAIINRIPLKPGDPYRGPDIIAPCEMEIANARAAAQNGATGPGCAASADFINKIKSLSAPKTP